MAQDSVELVRRLNARFKDFDLHQVETTLDDDALAEFFDPAIEWVPVQQSLLAVDPYRGYEGVRRFWRTFLSVWEDYGIEIEAIQTAGDRVVVRMRMRGRTQGVEINELWSSLFTLREGRIVRVQGFDSPSGAFEAAGVADQAPPTINP